MQWNTLADLTYDLLPLGSPHGSGVESGTTGLGVIPERNVAADPGLKGNMVGTRLSPIKGGVRPAAGMRHLPVPGDGNVIKPGSARSTGGVPCVGLSRVATLKSAGDPQSKGIDDSPKGRWWGGVWGLPDEVAYGLVV